MRHLPGHIGHRDVWGSLSHVSQYPLGASGSSGSLHAFPKEVKGFRSLAASRQQRGSYLPNTKCNPEVVGIESGLKRCVYLPLIQAKGDVELVLGLVEVGVKLIPHFREFVQIGRR